MCQELTLCRMVTRGMLVTLSVVLVGFILDLAEAGDYCLTDIYGYEYCPYGCCDDHSYYNKCCSVTTAIIVGAVVGGLAFIAFIAFIVICACYMYKQKGSRRGTVIHPNATTVVTNAFPMQPMQGQHYPQAGGFYMQQGFAGSSQGVMPSAPYLSQKSSDPAYPPPPVY